MHILTSASRALLACGVHMPGRPAFRTSRPATRSARRKCGTFLGAMSGKVDRGVFLTTSTFTQAAERELEGRGVRVVLIKGEELVDLMVEHGVGVEPIKVATIHRINEDFFDEL